MTSPNPLSRAVAQAARRHADQQTARFAEIPQTPWFFATVVAVASPAITVKWRGADVPGLHLASYTPAPGDRAVCALIDNQVVAFDKTN